MSENQGDQTQATDEAGSEQAQERTFTQADIDKAVKDRVARERAKYADYDDLKAKAGEQATAEERIAALEKQLEQTSREALRRRVQAAHGIADEDADLFLTASDEETLTAQAKRLAERTSERKQSNNVVPREGNTPAPAENETREFTRNLFARAAID